MGSIFFLKNQLERPAQKLCLAGESYSQSPQQLCIGCHLPLSEYFGSSHNGLSPEVGMVRLLSREKHSPSWGEALQGLCPETPGAQVAGI